MAWRYDPVIFNDRMGAEYHARKFSMMCSEASQWTDRCIFSFVDMYGKLSRFREDGTVRSVTASERARFAEMALDAVRENGMVLTSCCTDVPGVERRGCLDRTTMRSLSKKLPSMSDEEKLDLLATDGMLVKRPILVTEKAVLVGFKESEWEGEV